MENNIVTFIDSDPDYRFSGLPLRVEHVDGPTWMLAREVTYRTKDGELSTIREGFHFDFASVPRALWWLYPPHGTKGNPYGIAALVHDWLLTHKKIGGRDITRAEADAIFLEVLLYTGCRKTLAYTMYAAVSANTFSKRINPWGEKWQQTSSK